MSNLFITGTISGISAGVIMGLTSMALHATKICKLCIIAIGGGVFSGRLMEGYNVFGLILSWVIHFALSVFFAILIIIMLHYTGSKYYTIKGAGLLTLIFLANIGIIAPLRGIMPANPAFSDLLLLLFYHILFGVLAGFFIVKYRNEAISGT